MRRRSDIDAAEFQHHWLDPHGVMTAELPKVKRYVQGHVIPSPATSSLAKELPLDGFAVLSFDSYEDRQEAYTSPRIRECDKDSEEFVGSVSRVVTRSQPVIEPTDEGAGSKAYVIRFGREGADEAWSKAFEQRALGLKGVCGFTRHSVLSQAGAPGSKVPELALPVSGVAEVWFETEEDLVNASGHLAGADGGTEAAVYVARDHRFI
tara:strand:- start:14717 stop:15340 length:624 start_codon:yes stop_codon:yes gene_type:complete